MVRLIPRRKKAKKTPLNSPMENAEVNGRRTHWFKQTHKQRQKIIKEK